MARYSSSLTVAQVQNRLNKIIDHRLQYLLAIEKKQKKNVLVLNQAVLEEWAQLLNNLVYFKAVKEITSKAIQTKGHLGKQNTIQKVAIVPPIVKKEEEIQFLLDVQTNHIDVFEVFMKDRGALKAQVKTSSMDFNFGLVHNFCSCTMIDRDSAILIGGFKQTDYDIKSQDVMKLNLRTKQIVKIAHLPYGISSHRAQKIGNNIYIVGGNKNYSIVTKKCLKLNLNTYEVDKIADLNYPSASHSLLSWLDTYLYKIGGIGSCFGQWDLSPYIQRYDTVNDVWQIVNPNININQNMLHHYSLLVNSLSYVSNRGTIVVLGGFDFEQKGSRKMFEIQVEEITNEEGEAECIHNIIRVGEVPAFVPGGFLSQQTFTFGNCLYALEAIDDPKEDLTSKVLSISSKLSYL